MRCPYCKSDNSFVFYSAEMPNLLAACPESMLSRVRSLPFEASLCNECALGFNSTPLSEGELKEIYDEYLYISPMSGIGRTKYTDMIATLQRTHRPTDRLIEIGCSDGYMLSRLRDLGYRDLTGIEPAPQADSAQALGFTVIREYFRRGLFADQSVDGFFLMHVFEHFPDPFSVLEEMKRALAPSGSITLEVPHLEGFVHQHLFFYNMPFMRRLCREHGLKIVSAETDEMILRVVLAHGDDHRSEKTETGEATKDMIIRRARDNYRKFTEQVARLNTLVQAYREKTLFWWGAGSTGVVYLNQLRPAIRQGTQIEIVDGDKSKWGCYVPGPLLPVRSSETLKHRSVDCLVIASQFEGEIREALRSFNVIPKRIEVFSS